MKKLIKKVFNWIFSEEFKDLEYRTLHVKRELEKAETNNKRFEKLFANLSVSVDVHESPRRHSSSWACISLQGDRHSYLKFVDLGDRDLRDIANFLNRYERGTIDANPQIEGIIRAESGLLKNNKRNKNVKYGW